MYIEIEKEASSISNQPPQSYQIIKIINDRRHSSHPTKCAINKILTINYYK